MKCKIKIGNKEFKFKKDAIQHYRNILNSYDFGQSLNETDFNEIIDLLNYDHFNTIAEYDPDDENNDENEHLNNMEYTLFENFDESEICIIDIKVVRVQFNTKCFQIILNNCTRIVISYLMILNRTKYTPEKLFNVACRSSIQNDVVGIKKDFFNKHSVNGKVKCMETSILSQWSELVVDHRQPNTFSIIVDRFKEINQIDLDSIDFALDNENKIIFKDCKLAEQFRKYHSEKANLRIVRKECNSSRTNYARVKRSSKDLTVKSLHNI